MRCDAARPLLSEGFDGALAAHDRRAVDEHLGACADCAAFKTGLARLRRELRYEAVQDVADVAPAVLAQLGLDSQRRRRPGAPHRQEPHGRPPQERWPRGWPPPRPRPSQRQRPPRRSRLRATSAAAIFLAAVIAGASFAGLGGRRASEVRAEDLPQRVQSAQSEVRSLSAQISVVERGWHPQVPERRLSGTLRYSSPESLAVHLTDHTDYPSDQWVPNDVAVVITPGQRWSAGPAACPREALPSCMSPEPRVESLRGREPFPVLDPAPLDLVVPVRSFSDAGPPEPLGRRSVGERAAVGVAVTAAQADPLLQGLRQAGAWREIHPGDRVELWLDEQALVPLALSVIPSDDPERALWAARRGYRDAAAAPYLEVAFEGVRLNGEVPEAAFPSPPAGTAARDAGFRAGSPAGQLPAPGWLPPGMRPHMEGVVDQGGEGIAVAAWTDGRAWVKIRATEGWAGARLFGDLGPAPHRVELGATGVAYVSGRGHEVGLHAEGLDVVVVGSLTEPALIRIAASLGLVGRPVPPDWAEGGAASLEAARRALPGLLLPSELEGFAPPTVRIAGDIVTLTFFGPGSREFILTQGPGDRLSPPLDADVRGVGVRGLAGRYTPARGELEWVESGTVVSVMSHTLSVAELLAVAASLEAG
ncbi:MAG TPA: zf-HC2 domain-containing protein [Egibacteraceae bacterium]|nr:zf-HC2 domain-containing protein [Egibacteraceae bacterium]